ncbi:MAG: STAS domain-containing protein [Solirubrobacteraceae bacterium]|nr:STAS domain-containing protein [Solirubrobacteraceae bacterium]
MDSPDSLSFSSACTEEAGVVLVVLSGELDLFSAPRLRNVLEAACADGKPVCVDLAEVPFLDTTALAALLSARRAARDRRAPFVVAAAGTAVARILDQAGLGELLRSFPTRAEALAALSSAS